MTVTAIDLRRSWDAAKWQTKRLTPTRAAAALIEWSCNPDPVDSGIPGPIAVALAQALVDIGRVAGRWCDDPPGADSAYLPAAPRHPVRKLLDRLRGRTPIHLVLTRAPDQVVELLETGWSVQSQALIVVEHGPVELVDVIAALQERTDWRDFVLPSAAELLVGPAVDGDALMIAAPSEARLLEALRGVRRHFESAELPLGASWTEPTARAGRRAATWPL